MATSPASSPQYLLEFKKISKKFGRLFANEDISFSVQKSSIHAIVGENGAGKSTLMKILFGLYQADSGQILYNGQIAKFSSPLDAKRNGLGMVHQHFMLAGPISAIDHIFLDEESTLPLFKKMFWPLNRKQKIEQLQALSSRFKMPVPWHEQIDKLSVGIQQRIEILKILHNNADLLILDEPTAVLAPQEIELFFEQLRYLKSRGKTILIITHKLKEVLALADEVTVLRQGQHIASLPIQGQSIQSLSELMIGQKLQDRSLRDKLAPQGPNQVEVKNLNFQSAESVSLKDISFHIKAGEILGVAGVEGNGQVELINAFIRPHDFKNEKIGIYSGEVIFKGNNILKNSSQQIRQMGIAYFPHDRLGQGLLLNQNAVENFLIGQHHSSEFSRYGWILWDKVKLATKKVIEIFKITPNDISIPIGKFSGGNQQKFVVARELYHHPELLIAAQPTRGVDINAIETIHKSIWAAKNRGSAVLLISSDLEEIMKLSDRMIVVLNGQITGSLSAPDFEEKKIGMLMLGGGE